MKQFTIGVDLGGTFIKSALVSPTGEVAREWIRSTVPQRDEVITQLREVARECVQAAGELNAPAVAVGVATPGIIDADGKSIVGGAPNIEGWENVPLAKILSDTTSLPVMLFNDGNAMGYGEYRYGTGKGLSDVVFVCVGTGIGGAIITGGHMVTGYANRGAEIGCMPFITGGSRCSCGGDGCWEEYASTAAMVRRWKKKTGEDVNGKHIYERYKAGDARAKEIFETGCYYVGRGIAGLINIFAPQMVVLGGGISESGPEFLELVSKAAFENALKACSCNTKIGTAALGNRAGMIGAGALAVEKLGIEFN